MAVAVVAGLASTAGAYGTAVALGTVASFGLTAGLTAFAIGAGLSMISQALQPNLRVGQDTGLSTSVANPIAERPIIYGRTRTGGTIVYFTTSGADNKYLHLVIAVAGHAIDGYEKVYFDDQVIWEDGSYVDDWVQNAQINFYDGTQTTADQDLINASNEWNSNCILNDTAYIHVRLEYDPEVYTNGIPSITTTIRGKKVLDPRTDVTAWSENPALCIYDYLKDPKYGLNDDTVNEAQVIASANVCDQLVTIDTGVDHTRYALSGFISTGDTIKANLEKMLSSMFGKLVCSGGELFVNAGYYTSPVLDINESLLVGAVSLQTKTSRRNVYNAVKGTFLSEEENYIFADYPSIKSDTYSTEDGEPLYLDLPLPCTTNNVRAQRLAKLSLNKSRQQRSLSIPVNLAGLKVRAGDVIRFTSERLGISNAEYEVIDFEFEYSDQLIVNLVCVETGSSLYDWTVADKLDFSVGSDITLYDGTAIAPTGLTATAVSNILSDGTDSTYIDVAWTNPSDIYFDYVVLKYGDQSIVTKDRSYRINNVDENTQYTITISAYNTFGRQSTGLSTNVTTVRDTTAPANITSITATGGLQSIDLSWTNPSDDDFDLVRIKVASTNVEPASHSYEVRADNFIDDVGAYSATRYYWLAPVDRTGNVGNYVSGGSATTGSIDYGDINNPPTIPVVAEVATTVYLTLGDNNAPTDTEFNTAVGRDPIENDFVVVNKEFAFVYDGSTWSAVTEFIDGSLLVSGSLSADDITTGTLNANDVTISNLTVTSGQLPSDVVYDGDLGASGTTVIDGGRISAGTAVTVGTGDNVAVLSGSDATYRLWAGDATSADAPFKVSQAGTLYATNAVISGDITAGTINADNITFTGTLTADNLSGIPNVEALNMTQSMRNEIEEIIVTKFGSDASTGYYDEATGSFDAQDDNTQVCKINSFQHNGSNIDIDLTFSKAWQASSGDIPSVEVNIQRAPAGTTTWTTIKTQTVTGSAFYEPELGSWFANIQGYVSVTDNPATGNYDYRFLTGNVLNLSLISLSAKLEANEQGEQIGTIDLADYARIDQDETISGNYTFSGTTSGIDYNDLDNAPDVSGKANKSGDTFTGDVTFNTHIKLPQNPVGTTYGNGVSTIPTSMITQVVGTNDGWRLYGEGGSNDVKMMFEVIDDIETGDTWVFRNKKTYDPYTATEPFIIQGNGNIIATGTISASGYNNTNWDTAYTYSQTGHLPLAGGTLSGDIEVNRTDAHLQVHYSSNSRGGIVALSTQRVGMYTTSSNDDLVFGYSANPVTSAGFVERMKIDNGNGNILFNGNRPLTYNSDTGAITSKGNAGGWAIQHSYQGSSGTNHGGFGALGDSDTFNYYYIGASYNDASNIRIYKNGTINVGSSTVLDASRNLTNIGEISATNFTTESAVLKDGLPSHDWATVGDGNIGAVLRINDIDGANYILKTGSYDLTFMKHVTGSPNSFAEVMKFEGANASDSVVDVKISSGNLKMGSTTVIDASRNATLNKATLQANQAFAFTYSGSATYTQGALYCSQNDLTLEAPLTSNSSSASHVPLMFSWRGGYSVQGGIRVEDGFTQLDAIKIRTSGTSGTTVLDSARNLTNISSLQVGSGVKDQYNTVSIGGTTQYMCELEHNINATGSAYYDALSIVNTLNASNNYAQIGFRTNDADGTHHRATIQAHRDGNTTYGGVLKLRTRVSAGQPIDTLTLFSNGDVDVRRGNLNIVGTTVIDSSRNLTNIGNISASNINLGNDPALDWSSNTITLKSRTAIGVIKISGNGTYKTRIDITNAQDNATVGRIDPNDSSFLNGNFNLATGGLQIGGTTVIDSSRNLTNIGIIKGGSCSIDPNTYSLDIYPTQSGNATTGGWARSLNFRNGTSGTQRGHFGALGSADSIDYIYMSIGSGETDYSSNDFRVYSDRVYTGNRMQAGYYQVGSTTVIDSSRGLVNATKLQVTGKRSTHLQPFTYILDNHNASVDGTKNSCAFSVRSALGNHSWGITQELRVNATTGDSPSLLFSKGGTTNTFSIGYGYNDTGVFRIKRDHGYLNSGWGTALMSIDRSGNVTFAGNVTAYSDKRLKTNIKTIDNSLDIISKIRGVTFDWIENGEKAIGVIAQEIEAVPELACLVSETAEDGSSEFRQKNVAYGNMVGLLIEAIKELKQEIEELKNGNHAN